MHESGLLSFVLLGKEQVVPTEPPTNTDSTKIKNLAPSPDYIKQFELFSGNDIFATREE